MPTYLYESRYHNHKVTHPETGAVIAHFMPRVDPGDPDADRNNDPQHPRTHFQTEDREVALVLEEMRHLGIRRITPENPKAQAPEAKADAPKGDDGEKKGDPDPGKGDEKKPKGAVEVPKQ